MWWLSSAAGFLRIGLGLLTCLRMNLHLVLTDAFIQRELQVIHNKQLGFQCLGAKLCPSGTRNQTPDLAFPTELQLVIR